MSGSEPVDPFADAPVIFSYSRAQAIEDGVLIDLSEWAAELGFRYPVACTAAVWQGHVVPGGELRELGQSERGRAHDLLWMLRNAIRRRPHGDRVEFQTVFLQRPRRHVTVTFNAVCGPGDAGEPVLTIMLPQED